MFILRYFIFFETIVTGDVSKIFFSVFVVGIKKSYWFVQNDSVCCHTAEFITDRSNLLIFSLGAYDLVSNVWKLSNNLSVVYYFSSFDSFLAHLGWFCKGMEFTCGSLEYTASNPCCSAWSWHSWCVSMTHKDKSLFLNSHWCFSDPSVALSSAKLAHNCQQLLKNIWERMHL